MKRAHHLIDGLKLGLESLYWGVEKGIVGVIKKPFNGAQNNGFPGFLSGTMLGLSGIVLKPVTGILDLTSKFTEGVKNTATYYDDKANDVRVRYPRVFYDRLKYIKSYK